jgi:hypothetical protein
LLGGSVPASAQALTWSVVPSPNQGTSRNILRGVSCASAVACTAAGFTFRNAVYKTVIESGAASG